jgi:NADH-quinone oxidoreductase chain G
MIKIEINGLEFLVKQNLSVLEACKYVGITIPRFCYHETLSVAGNCRMCLVEIGNSPKPVASCALPILNNMKIFVNTPLVKKARENVLETLLLNHPLDCPICDQGGECDLQDQTKVFGGDYSRFFFNKRSVEDKYCGPLIKTIMTRCIHCTRCVRFGAEIAGVEYLGTLNRGGSTEIGGYLSSSFNSEISGNVIDLCPVGALTSKPYAFKARPWELRSNESIDITDSTGSNIYVNFKESEILRILPKINIDINESIISDKARFSYDSVKSQRIHKLFSKNGSLKLETQTWKEIFIKIENILSDNKKVIFLVNEELDLESLAFLKQLSYEKNGIQIRSILKKESSSNVYINYLSNNISDLKSKSKVCFLISSNIRIESAIINTKLRLKYVNEDFSVYGLTQKFNSTFCTQFVNLSFNNLIKVFEGKDIILSKLFISYKAPIICLGSGSSTRGLDNQLFLTNLKKVVPSAIFLNIKSSCNSESISSLNIKPITKQNINQADFIFAINLDNNLNVSKLLTNKNFIWINSHGSKLALKSSSIIPILSEFEEEKIFINLEQRPQKTIKSLSGIADARSFKLLIKSLISQKNSLVSKFNNELLKSPDKFNKMSTKLTNNSLLYHKYLFQYNTLQLYPLKSNLEDFYSSNKATKNSAIMSQCSQEMRKISTNF